MEQHSLPLDTEYSPAQLFLKGKEALQAGECESAVQSFGEALEKATKEKEDLDPQLAEYYYYHGYALLRKHQEDNQDDLFGEGLMEAAESGEDKSQNQDEEEEEEEEEEEKEEEEGEEGEEVSSAGDSSSQNPSNLEYEEEASIENEFKELLDDPHPQDATDTTQDFQSNPDPDEALDDIQLAWENLECARLIHTKNYNSSALMQIHTTLGELQMWKDSPTKAIEEYSQALTHANLLNPNRMLAALYFQLGNAYLSNPASEEQAVYNYQLAINTLSRVKSSSEEIEELISQIEAKKDEAVEQGKLVASMNTGNQKRGRESEEEALPTKHLKLH